jgi:hypothetical protein
VTFFMNNKKVSELLHGLELNNEFHLSMIGTATPYVNPRNLVFLLHAHVVKIVTCAV